MFDIDKINSSYETMLELNAEIFISELMKHQKKSKLYEQIDLALATRDKSKFIELTNELKQYD